ncbi:MAG: alpha-2-macroglobulin family protein, partial [Planctomycetota bacterium]
DSAQLTRGKLKGHLNRIYESRDELTDYGRAYLALALHAAGRSEEAQIVVENFQNTAVVDEKTRTVYWGRPSGWWYWYHGATETTAWVVQAMLSVSPENEHVPMAVNWLIHNRRELAWYNTKATAMAVYALARFARTTGELDCDQTFEVVVDDSLHQTLRVNSENLFTFDDRIVIPADQLSPGEHSVRITRTGTGTLYWGAYLRYFTIAEQIEGGGHQLTLDRKYFRLVGEEFTNTRNVWKEGKKVTEEFQDFRYARIPLAIGAEITSGELIEVELTIDAENHLEYMVFEDPKPAGCEPYRLTSGASYGGGTYANMELRDTKIAFFASYLRKGSQKLSYRLVCETPGTFRILPSAAEAMYSPFVEAISDSGKLVITTKPQEAQ